MEKFQEMLHKLQLECEKARKRPVHVNKQFEIAELGINTKQSKKDRLTIINAWLDNCLEYAQDEFPEVEWQIIEVKVEKIGGLK